MNRWLIVLAGLLLPHCTGCLYYAYPTISHVPELTVPNPDGSVHAFRVDIDRTERRPDPPTTQYTLSRITIDARGQVPSQLEIAPVTGIYNPLGVIDGAEHEHSRYLMTVRLYRPGSCTQEVKSWDKTRELQWTPAPDLMAQEKAIDDLLALPSTPDQPSRGTWWDQKDEKKPGLGLQPGAVSWMHRDALIFAANEYLRLIDARSTSTQDVQAVRDRLRNKSQWLRSYADRQPPEIR